MLCSLERGRRCSRRRLPRYLPWLGLASPGQHTFSKRLQMPGQCKPQPPSLLNQFLQWSAALTKAGSGASEQCAHSAPQALKLSPLPEKATQPLDRPAKPEAQQQRPSARRKATPEAPQERWTPDSRLPPVAPPKAPSPPPEAPVPSPEAGVPSPGPAQLQSAPAQAAAVRKEAAVAPARGGLALQSDVPAHDAATPRIISVDPVLTAMLLVLLAAVIWAGTALRGEMRRVRDDVAALQDKTEQAVPFEVRCHRSMLSLGTE